MFMVIACLAGIFAILVIADFLKRYKIFKGENQRKFVHISAGTFIAFWPWLISWREIEYIGLAMLLVVLLNHFYKIKFLHFNSSVKRRSYGDIFFALAVIACALLIHNKIFFALAILNLALADGLASLIGQNFGKHWRYRIFHHDKTVIGSMTFWLVSVFILGIGLPFAHDLIDFKHFAILLIALPPVLAALENFCMMGLDDLAVPLLVILVLRMAQIG